MISFLGAIVGKWYDYVPHLFCLTASTGKIKLNIERIVEAVIIAIILGFFFDKAIEPIKDSVIKLEQKVDKIYEDIYAPTLKK